MVSQECAVCDGRISRFIKEQEANESWGRLGIKIAILLNYLQWGIFRFKGIKWMK